MIKKDYSQIQFVDKIVDTKRVSKTVVVGDGEGHVGYGTGKAAEIQEAMRKALDAAKRNVIEVSLNGTTIPHEIIGEYGSGKVLLKPAAPGTGVIAGGTMRAVFDAVGIKDVRAKSLRSNTPINVVKATFEALSSLRTVEQIAQMRGIPADQVK